MWGWSKGGAGEAHVPPQTHPPTLQHMILSLALAQGSKQDAAFNTSLP